jgi:hypothetical protein
MIPPIFTLVSEDSECVSLLGDSPVRFFPFGEAPQHVTVPYATWQLVSGVPGNHLDCPPTIDSITVQVDIWTVSQKDARDIFDAMRGAIEEAAHIMGVNVEGREPDTRLYRVSFTVDFWTERN